MKIGFIGLGNVGGKLAGSLLRNKFDLTVRDLDDNLLKEFKKKSINIINVDFKFKNAFSKITSDSNRYIEDCFDVGIKLMNTYKLTKLINGPISKKHFLKKRFPGITEYIGDKTNCPCFSDVGSQRT